MLPEGRKNVEGSLRHRRLAKPSQPSSITHLLILILSPILFRHSKKFFKHLNSLRLHESTCLFHDDVSYVSTPRQESYHTHEPTPLSLWPVPSISLRIISTRLVRVPMLYQCLILPSSLPASVRIYFCNLLLGASGIVISIYLPKIGSIYFFFIL